MKHRIRAYLTGLLSFLLYIGLVLPCAGQIRLYEDFERDAGDWPWTNGEHTWQLHPEVQTQDDRQWSVTEGQLYHEGIGQNALMSPLYAGGVPGVDAYPPLQNAWAVWGPFDLTNATAAVGGFWLWAEMEPWDIGDGDNMLITATSSESDNFDVFHWGIAYDCGSGTTNGEWQYIDFDLDNLDSLDADISCLGRANVFLAIVFVSNDNDNSFRGAAVDDFWFASTSDEPDFALDSLRFVLASDTTFYAHTLLVNWDFRAEIRYRAQGMWPPVATTHRITIEGAGNSFEDEISGEWSFDQDTGETIQLFPNVWIPGQAGEVQVLVNLDDDNELFESDEENNSLFHVFNVEEAYSPEGTAATPGRFEIRSIHPNPFNAGTRIVVSSAMSGMAAFEIFSLDGRRIDSFTRPVIAGQDGVVTWRPFQLSSGIYVVRAAMGAQVVSHPVLLVK